MLGDNRIKNENPALKTVYWAEVYNIDPLPLFQPGYEYELSNCPNMKFEKVGSWVAPHSPDTLGFALKVCLDEVMNMTGQSE